MFQFLFSVLILSVLLPHSSSHIKWVVSAGLAQVSEFSFVLCSRARRLGLISREVTQFYRFREISISIVMPAEVM